MASYKFSSSADYSMRQSLASSSLIFTDCLAWDINIGDLMGTFFSWCSPDLGSTSWLVILDLSPSKTNTSNLSVVVALYVPGL